LYPPLSLFHHKALQQLDAFALFEFSSGPTCGRPLPLQPLLDPSSNVG